MKKIARMTTLLAALLMTTAFATVEDLQPIPEELQLQFEERLQQLELLTNDFETFERRLVISEGLLATVAAARLDTLRENLFSITLGLASDIAEQRKQGFDVSQFEAATFSSLRAIPDRARKAMLRLEKSVSFDYSDLGPRETVIKDAQLLAAIKRADITYRLLIDYTDIAESMDFDASEQVTFLKESLAEAAINRSVFLAVAVSQVSLAKSATATLPDDEELPFWLKAAEARVGAASSALQSVVTLMNRLDLDSRQYRQQILTATGALTADVLDVSILGGIVGEWSRATTGFVRSEGLRWVFQLVLVLLILVLFTYLAKGVRKGVETAMLSSKVNMSRLLKRMIVSTAKNLTLFVGVLFALSQLGISLGPLLAGLGIAGFIIGFALQDTLSNFASGMMILIYRPFDVGDFVEAGGVTGRVDRMSLVNSTFKTLDNQVIVVPNNMIWQQVITNLTAQHTRRVDLTFSIAYGDDIDAAKDILRDVVANYEACLKKPEPNIRVSELGESSVNLICRPWVRTDDYWDTYWDLIEIVKKRFDNEGITIPFPQREIHMVQPQET